MKTEKMIEKIINEIGVPLPTFDYNIKLFKVILPMNISTSELVIGTNDISFHATFEIACRKIISWHIAS